MPSKIHPAASHQVTTALQRASAATGAGLEFLKKMAARESGFDPKAKAKTSSAAGLFQFIEQTWLGAVKHYGGKHGLEAFAADITRGPDGRYRVADETRRKEILDLRFDVEASAALAGEIANENRAHLEKRLGRAASSADLYAAHFLGPAGAVKLLSAASSMKAADIVPAAAAANRPVFYDGARPRTVGEVIASIASSMNGAGEAEPLAADETAPAERKALTPVLERRARLSRPAIAGLSAPAPLSSLALQVLQALDPSRLGGKGERDAHSKRFGE